MASVPTQRTLKKLRAEGYLCAIVEHWNQFAHVRQDLFGIIDIIAVHPIKKKVLGIQACTDTGGQASKHKQKCEENKNLKTWLQSGCKFEIWAWAKKGKAKQRKLWTLRIIKTNEGEQK